MAKKLFDSNAFMLAVYAVLSIAGMLVVFGAVLNYSAHDAGKLSVVASAFALVPAAAVFVTLLLRWKGVPENVFVIIAIPIASAFALLFLPNHIPDEIWHVYRMLTIENPGNGMVVPVALDPGHLPTTYGEMRDALGTNVSWTDTMPLERDLSSYLTHMYLIPGLVAKLCRFLGVNLFATIYIARFVNAALFVVAGYWIVRLMPMAKVVVCVYLLNPLMIQQEASCSADAITNILALLFIAMIVKARFDETIGKRALVGLVVLFVFTSLSKYAYAFLVFLFLLLVPHIADKRKRIGIYAGTVAIVVAGTAFVLFFVTLGEHQGSIELLRHPGELVAVVGNTVYQLSPWWMQQFLGSSLSNLDVIPWEPAIWAYGFTLLLTLVFNLGERLSFNRIEKIGIIALVAFITFAIIVSFRTWSVTVEMRSDIILGMQGRYFLPYFLLPLLCLSTPRASLVRENCMIAYAIVLVCVYALDLFAIVGKFV